jgi:transposase
LAPIQRTGEKNGTKRNALADENGVPLAVIIGGANRHDSIFLSPLLEACIIRQPNEIIKNLCLDAGYTGKEKDVWDHAMIPHIRPRGEEKTLIEKDPSFKPRRWVVEALHSWFNRFCKLIPRYEKTDSSHYALIALAASMITLNECMVIYG